MARTNPPANFGRTLPHSTEAEEKLISACFIDGSEVVARCMMERVSPESFYDPKHGLIFEKIVALYRRGEPIETAVVAQELRDAKQLDNVGGWAFIAQVSASVGTTAETAYFIKKVKELETRRQMVRAFTEAVEDCYTETTTAVEELLAKATQRMRSLQAGGNTQMGRPATAFAVLPPENDPSSLLGKYRYVGRGDGVLIVSSSGMGKSVMNYEWALLNAVGKPFAGIECKRPLKSLIVQAEDSDGDIKEVVFSVCTAHQFTAEQMAMIEKNVIIESDRESRGDKFLVRLRALVDKHQPDLVWINPLHSYAGCDIADASEIGGFLRAGLNAINKDNKFAYMIIHHTPKPVSAKNVPDRKWHEFMYDAAGSAELVNWARAVITLKPTETEGQFNLVLAKRGKRAGVVVEVHSESGQRRWEPTIKIPMQHSSETIKVDGREHPFNVIHWEMRALSAEETAATEKPVEKKKPQGREPRGKAFEPTYSNEELILMFPGPNEEPTTFTAALRAATECTGISKATFSRRRAEMQAAELITFTDDARWRRTERGQNLAVEVLKNRK